jgi:hypothetical protein
VKIVAKILRRRIKNKIEGVLREDQYGFKRGKELGMQLGCLEYQNKTWSQMRLLIVCFIDCRRRLTESTGPN